jgi:hypothetical protein
MATTTHIICWTVQGISSTVTIDGVPALKFDLPTNTQQTSYEFDQGATCPASDAKAFSIAITPKDQSGAMSKQIETIVSGPYGPNGLGKLTFVDNFTNNETDIYLNMKLTATAGSVPTYVIDGGKPVIRNRPSVHPIVIGVGVLIVIAVIAIFAYQRFRNRNGS